MDQQLLAFVSVVEAQNFTRAAQKLHMSQPAISQHIQNLENQLDVKLLDRTNKYVRLNKAGEVVYRHARDILHLYQQMERQVQDLKGEAVGPLIIGSSFTFGEYVLPHMIAEFKNQYPNVTPRVFIENTHTVVEKVVSGELDIGIVEGNVSNKEVTVVPFAEDTVVLVAAYHDPIAATGEIVTPEQLEQEDWIIREQGSGTREMTDHVFNTYNIHPKSITEYSSTQMIKASVEAGLGLTLLSKWVIRKELQWKTLREIRVTDSPIQRQFSFVLRNTGFSTKSSEVFCEFLSEHAQLPSYRL